MTDHVYREVRGNTLVDIKGNVMARNVTVRNSGNGGVTCRNCGGKKRATVAGVAQKVKALQATVASMRPSLTEQVDAELKQHPGVFAIENGAGVVRAFMAPVPYWKKATNEGGDIATPPSSEELEKQKAKLAAQLPGLRGAERAKVEHDIRVLEREITVARSAEAADRRHKERRRERERQRYGRE